MRQKWTKYRPLCAGGGEQDRKKQIWVSISLFRMQGIWQFLKRRRSSGSKKTKNIPWTARAAFKLFSQRVFLLGKNLPWLSLIVVSQPTPFIKARHIFHDWNFFFGYSMKKRRKGVSCAKQLPLAKLPPVRKCWPIKVSKTRSCLAVWLMQKKAALKVKKTTYISW